MIDFEIPEDAKIIRETVRKFVREHCIPAEEGLTADTFDETLKEVFVQLRGSSGFTPITRHVFNPIKKTSTNEVVIQLMIEVK